MSLEFLAQKIRERQAEIAQAVSPAELLRLEAEGERLMALLLQFRAELAQEDSELGQMARFVQASRVDTPSAVIDVKG
jgi:hypothetical protein